MVEGVGSTTFRGLDKRESLRKKRWWSPFWYLWPRPWMLCHWERLVVSEQMKKKDIEIFRLASTMPQILVLLNRSCKGGLRNAEAKDLLSLQVVREQSWTKISFSPEFQQGTQVLYKGRQRLVWTSPGKQFPPHLFLLGKFQTQLFLSAAKWMTLFNYSTARMAWFSSSPVFYPQKAAFLGLHGNYYAIIWLPVSRRRVGWFNLSGKCNVRLLIRITFC